MHFVQFLLFFQCKSFKSKMQKSSPMYKFLLCSFRRSFDSAPHLFTPSPQLLFNANLLHTILSVRQVLHWGRPLKEFIHEKKHSRIHNFLCKYKTIPFLLLLCITAIQSVCAREMNNILKLLIGTAVRQCCRPSIFIQTNARECMNIKLLIK